MVIITTNFYLINVFVGNIITSKKQQYKQNYLNVTQYEHDEIIQIIPQEKKNKFEKNKFTILQIEV
mgnify:CR=1 FL=1